MSARRPLLLLALIVLVAVGLRLWNYDFEMRHRGRTYTADAFTKIQMVLATAAGDTEPNTFKQPYFLIYSTALLFRGLWGAPPYPDALIWRVATLCMIAYSVATVLLVYALGRAAFARHGVGLAAAALFAVAPLAVTGSRYFKEDTPLMFFATASLLALLRVLQRPTRSAYLLAGALLGLSLSAKFAAVALIPFFLVVHGLARRATQPAPRHGRLVLSLLLAAVFFVLVNPHTLLHGLRFAGRVADQATYVANGHWDGTVIRGVDYLWTFYLRHALAPGLTPPALLAALAGLVLAFRRPQAAPVLLGAWVVIGYLVLEQSPAKPFPFFARYALILLPALCVFAGHALASAWTALSATPVGRTLGVLLFAGVLAPPLAKSALIDRALVPDTREQAIDWMNKNLEPGAAVCVDDRSYAAAPATNLFAVTARFPATPRQLRRMETDYVVVSSFSYERYRSGKKNLPKAQEARATYEELFHRYRVVKEFRPAHPCQTYGFHNPVITVLAAPRTPPAVSPGNGT